MKRNPLKFALAGLMLTLGAVAFGVATFSKQGASLDHYTPDQLVAANPASLTKRGLQVDGYVAEGSERFDPTIPELRFQVRDLNKKAFVRVVYREGLKPDTFKEGEGVVVEGRYDPVTQTIHASKLMTKCPSKYEAVPGEATKTASAAEGTQ
jgi:cytochrome c-type biogenesis protein CcmE